MSQQFVEYMRGWIEQYGTATKLAGALEMTLSAFLRAIKHEGTLSIENCVRFAQETGEAPGKVLRLAGKADVAELLERVYGGAPAPALNSHQRELLTLWEQIDHDARDPILVLLRGLAEKRTSARGKSRRARRVS